MRIPHESRCIVTLNRLVPALLLLGTALVVVSLVSQGGAGAASSGPIPGTGIIRYGTWSSGSDYDRYSYVTVGVGDAAKAGALATKSLVYMNGTSVQTTWSTGVSYQESLANGWLLKDANGNYLRNVAYGAYVGDVGNAAYQQRFVDNVAALLTANGNEGTFIDDVLKTPEVLTEGVWPAKYPTQQAWEDATVSFVASVGSKLRSKGFYVSVNATGFVPGDPGSNDGSTTVSFWRRLAPHVSGLMSEYWEQLPTDKTQLRPSGTSSWTQHWDEWFGLMDVAQGGGADFFGLIQGSTTSVNMMRYGKASFLLGWDGSGGGFVYHPNGDPWNLEWTMDIGQPSGARYPVGVGWRRDYSGGTVILNSSASTSQTFPLGAVYTRADGTAVTSVTLAPTSALVLKRDGGSPPPPPPPPPPPANTSLPAITGTALQGETLSTSTGSWSNSPTGYAYLWKRCDTEGANCASISGATAARYTVAVGDVGKRLRVTVTASNSGGSGSATSNATGVVNGAPPPPPPPPPTSQPPVATALPVISGTPQEGQTLSTSTGSWSNSPTGYAYQWKRCDSTGANCASIGGATASQYTLGGADVSKRLRMTVTASNSAGSGSATSNATAAVAPAPKQAPKIDVRPVLSGTPQESFTLSATTGTWSNSPRYHSFQWRRCNTAGGGCSDIGGATDSRYKVGPADVGRSLRAVVAASNESGVSYARTDASSVVTPQPAPSPAPITPGNIAPPAIGGTPQSELTLTASTGTWSGSPTSYVHQWKRCDGAGANCASIAGATAAKYLLGSSDVGKTLRVTVTASNASASASATSAATATVSPSPAPPPAAPRPTNVSAPTVMGARRVGRELKSSLGEWANAPTRFTYQWQRCREFDSGCVAITAATGSSYVPTPDDVDLYVMVVVTAWNAAGSASAASVERSNERTRIRP